MSDVIINKAATIERCVQRIRDEYGGDPRHLHENITKQDAIILNLQRACEACIDIAMVWVRSENLGLPQHSRESFDLLEQTGKLEPDLANALKQMVGFRNIAVHDYQTLHLPIVQSIIEKHLDNFLAFASRAIKNSLRSV